MPQALKMAKVPRARADVGVGAEAVAAGVVIVVARRCCRVRSFRANNPRARSHSNKNQQASSLPVGPCLRKASQQGPSLPRGRRPQSRSLRHPSQSP